MANLKGVFDASLMDFSVAHLDRLPAIDCRHRVGVAVFVGTDPAQGRLVPGKIGGPCNKADLWYLARSLLKTDVRRLTTAAKDVRPALAAIKGMSPAQVDISYVLGVPQRSACFFGRQSWPTSARLR